MNYTKQALKDRILAANDGIETEKHIRSVMEKFKHYKQVNNKFIDALKESGEYHAYIIKDSYSFKIVCYKNNPKFGYNDRVEFSYYVSNCIDTTRCLTWQGIEESLTRHKFEERRNTYIEMLNNRDNEIQKLKELQEYIKPLNFQCFEIGDIKYKLDSAFYVINKGE